MTMRRQQQESSRMAIVALLLLLIAPSSVFTQVSAGRHQHHHEGRVTTTRAAFIGNGGFQTSSASRRTARGTFWGQQSGPSVANHREASPSLLRTGTSLSWNKNNSDEDDAENKVSLWKMELSRHPRKQQHYKDFTSCNIVAPIQQFLQKWVTMGLITSGLLFSNSPVPLFGDGTTSANAFVGVTGGRIQDTSVLVAVSPSILASSSSLTESTPTTISSTSMNAENYQFDRITDSILIGSTDRNDETLLIQDTKGFVYDYSIKTNGQQQHQEEEEIPINVLLDYISNHCRAFPTKVPSSFFIGDGSDGCIYKIDSPTGLITQLPPLNPTPAIAGGGITSSSTASIPTIYPRNNNDYQYYDDGLHRSFEEQFFIMQGYRQPMMVGTTRPVFTNTRGSAKTRTSTTMRTVTTKKSKDTDEKNKRYNGGILRKYSGPGSSQRYMNNKKSPSSLSPSVAGETSAAGAAGTVGVFSKKGENSASSSKDAATKSSSSSRRLSKDMKMSSKASSGKITGSLTTDSTGSRKSATTKKSTTTKASTTSNTSKKTPSSKGKTKSTSSKGKSKSSMRSSGGGGKSRGGGGGHSGCFSGDSLIEVQRSTENGITIETMLLKYVQLGDKVRSSAEEVFSTVYAFGTHIDEAKGATFNMLQLETLSGSTLTLTENHLVLVKKTSGLFRHQFFESIHAQDVEIGDEMILTDAAKPSAQHGGDGRIVKVSEVFRNDAYHPLTYDGHIVVNGIVSSVHATDGVAPVIEGFGGRTMIGIHSFQQLLYSPLRVLCQYSFDDFCSAEINHDLEDGSHHYIDVVESLQRFLFPTTALKSDQEKGTTEETVNVFEWTAHLPFRIMLLLLLVFSLLLENILFRYHSFMTLAVVSFAILVTMRLRRKGFLENKRWGNTVVTQLWKFRTINSN